MQRAEIFFEFCATLMHANLSVYIILCLQCMLALTATSVYVYTIQNVLFPMFLLCSYVWGAIADRKGRKPVLLVSILLTGISSLAFGFSVNFPMAVILRFLSGLANGRRNASSVFHILDNAS